MFLAGCGGNVLEGSVTLDGQPLAEGTISLIPKGGGASFGAEIKNGKYSLTGLQQKKILPGTYRVEINSFKKTGKTIPNKSDAGTSIEETVQLIPTRYNSKSELTTEITSGSNTGNFELKSGGETAPTGQGSPKPKEKAIGD
jgi:hypothetical protein